jgi:hypothetical protein
LQLKPLEEPLKPLGDPRTCLSESCFQWDICMMSSIQWLCLCLCCKPEMYRSLVEPSESTNITRPLMKEDFWEFDFDSEAIYQKAKGEIKKHLETNLEKHFCHWYWIHGMVWICRLMNLWVTMELWSIMTVIFYIGGYFELASFSLYIQFLFICVAQCLKTPIWSDRPFATKVTYQVVNKDRDNDKNEVTDQVMNEIANQVTNEGITHKVKNKTTKRVTSKKEILAAIPVSHITLPRYTYQGKYSYSWIDDLADLRKNIVLSIKICYRISSLWCHPDMYPSKYAASVRFE